MVERYPLTMKMKSGGTVACMPMEFQSVVV